MKQVSRQEHEALVANARVLEEQSFGVKVWLLPDQRVVKMFRVKRRFSSGRLYPYNLRFARNAARLQARGVAAPNILETFFCPEIERHGVVYERLEGEPFYELFQNNMDEALFETLAGFLAELHEKGIYFRSVHPGNVLLKSDGSMGLIDIQDLRFWPWALNRSLRARNFRHLYNSDEHSLAMREFGFERFVDLYLKQLPREESYRNSLKPLIMDFDRAWERKRK
ncbi:hypothetical protein [Thiolapillus sp.]